MKGEDIMEKLGQRIKESIDQIPVPQEKLDLAVNEAFTKTKMNRKQPKRFQAVMVGVASLFMIGLVGLLFSTMILHPEESATSSSPNNGAFVASEDERMKRVIEEGRMKSINQVGGNQDLTITLKEAYYDNGLLAIRYEVEVAEGVFNTTNEIPFEAIELLIDGYPYTYFDRFSFSQNETHYEDILLIENLIEYPDTLAIDVLVPELKDGIIASGKEILSMEVEKDPEETVKEFYAKKELAEDFRFEVGELRVTPSQVTFQTKIRLPKEERTDTQPTYGITVMEKEEDGRRFNQLPRIIDLKTTEDYTDISYKYTAYKSEVHVSRDLFKDQFMVIPYVYTGDEPVKQTDLQIGGTLALDQYPIEIKRIEEAGSHTKVIVQAENTPVHYPFHMVTAYHETNDQVYKALSFNKREDGFIEIVYPKIEKAEEAMLFMYNITIFDELVVEVDVN